MKTLMITTAIVTALAAPVVAQTSDLTTTAPVTETTTQAGTGLFRTETMPGDILASDFIGMRLYAAATTPDAMGYSGVQGDWSDVGEVNDVLLTQSGQVQAVLVDIGGFLGIGERRVAVDMSQIKFVKDDATTDNSDDFFLVITADRSVLENAPAFGARVLGNASSTDPAAMTDPAAAPTAAGEEIAAAPADNAATAPMARDGYLALNLDTLTAEQLTGVSAYDPTDKAIGTVSQVVVNAEGRVTEAVIDVGGFLGIGAKPVALPVADIQIMEAAQTKEMRVYVPFTKDQLKAMPEYQS